MSIPISAFDPRYSCYLRGFDRRGAAASLNNVSQTGLTVSGYFSDIADFAVLVLFDTDDFFGHLYSNKYLPTFDLAGVVVDFDLSTSGCFNPVSQKFASVGWNELWWIKSGGTSGQTQLVEPTHITSTTGGVAASQTYTLNSSGSPAVGDEINLIYMGNVQFDLVIGSTVNGVVVLTLAQAAVAMAWLVNNYNYPATGFPALTATSFGVTFTVTHSSVCTDGNSVQLVELHKNTTTYLTPSGVSNLVGGVDPTSIHIQLDLHVLGLESVRQLWFVIAPILNYDSSGGPALLPYVSQEFAYSISNISLTDPNTKCPLKIADPGKSVVVDSRDLWVKFTGNWNQEAGFYHRGFAKASSVVGDVIEINYNCQYTHDLYLGTALYLDRGKFTVLLDGVAQADIDTYLNVSSQVITRRILSTGIPPGKHQVVLTLVTGIGSIGYFDYLHAVVATNPIVNATQLASTSAALDFDTDQTYKIAPARNLYNFQTLGLAGDVDLYAGVFFALKRIRRGGSFHQATITLGGSVVTGDSFFVNIGGTNFGVGITPYDTLSTLAQRVVDAINALFVGVCSSSILGVITVVVLSPINGFSIAVTPGVHLTVTLAGDILAGNEGIWEADSSQSLPLNRAFTDYLNDFITVFTAASITFVLAFSQEILAPPDDNTVGGSWIERFVDGSTVLTATEFGSWGAGFVEAFAAGVVTQTGHGYISGYLASFNLVGAYPVTVIDVDHYSVSGVTPAPGDSVNVQLQTSQCNFNPATMTVYMANVYLHAASLGVLWLQFGEVGWWFFAGNGPSMAYYDAYTSDAANTSLGRALASFTGPNNDPSVNSFADADFLQNQVKTHISTIRSAVLAGFPSVQFELLWPYDVNYKTEYKNGTYPFLIGGQLNRYVNLPVDYYAPGSDIDRMKMEALAWGTSYRNLTLAIETMQFPVISPCSWPIAGIFYLIPWQNGGCPWVNEALQTFNQQIQNLVYWAMDHIILFSWDLRTVQQFKSIQ